MLQEDFGHDTKGFNLCVTDYIRFCEEPVVPPGRFTASQKKQNMYEQGHQGPVDQEEVFHCWGQWECPKSFPETDEEVTEEGQRMLQVQD